MAHRSEDNDSAHWLKILRLDTFWLLTVFLFLNYYFIQTQIREVVSRRHSPNERLNTRVGNKDSPEKKPTTEVVEYKYKYVGLTRLRHDIKTRSMMVVFSCLMIPLLALECCWVYPLFCQLVVLLFSISSHEPWKPYFLLPICLFLETVLSTAALVVWTFLAVRVLEAQVSYIRALINLPILLKVNKDEESRSESPVPRQPVVPPNTPELALSERSSFDTSPRTPESASSTLPSSPKMAPLRRWSSSTAASFVDAREQLSACSPPTRPDSQSSAFDGTGLQFKVARENRFHRSSTSGTTWRSESACSHWYGCSPASEASLSSRRSSPENITSADEADYFADESGLTMSLAAPMSSRAFPTGWWDIVFDSSTTPEMAPLISPRLPASTTSSTAPTSVQQDSEDADVAAYVEDNPTETPSTPVLSWTFREPGSTNTSRFSDQRTRNSSTASDPGSYGRRWCV
ncbi:uncharacterized protein FTOL_12142 [Fusarium torulosum]|uniref:Transmembrane protein n=1 Tax=Fusarium torulosum TaxID=33205 RepID=A0AAE8MJM1_9HYPO|nr:uncharacterized protein FTOL_12142 [Fusarium torulosum]